MSYASALSRAPATTTTAVSVSVPTSSLTREQQTDNFRFANLVKQNVKSTTQVVLVPVGLPGCGKSTFAKALDEGSKPGSWYIANQDIAGDRKTVERNVSSALAGHLSGFRGKRIIVDRCNFNDSQRATWLSIAKYRKKVLPTADVVTLCVVLPNSDDPEFCAQRAIARGNDGIHPDNADWRKINRDLWSQYQSPSQREGFTATYWCEDQASLDRLTALLSANT